jgi:5'-nucleotidase
MLLLLTNDDGFEAVGLEALAQAVAPLGELVVVAPDRPWSGCGHRVTVQDHIRVEERAAGRYAVSGTPADCVRLALQLLPERPAAVLSGINIGGNLGVDVFHSGTVAAAREAALHGLPAVAISQLRKPDLETRWEEAARWARRVLAELLAEPLPARAFWNVNLPCLPARPAPPSVVRCPLDLSPMPLAYALGPEGYRYCGRYHERARLPAGDVDVCFGGDISVTLVAP